MVYVILVTGSRDWPEPDYDQVLTPLIEEIKNNTNPGDEVIIRKGDCPTGVDAMIPGLIPMLPPNRSYTVQIYRANWNKFGRKAGPIRNQEMVDAGADKCLAFPTNHSKGTKHCAWRAEIAGISVRRFKLRRTNASD